MIAVAALVGCGEKEDKKLITDPIGSGMPPNSVEEAIRMELKKPTGKHTKAECGTRDKL